jgi:hypothetical protein
LVVDPEVGKRLTMEQIEGLANPVKYVGQSEEIIRTVYEKYHAKKTFAERAAA